MMIRTYSLKQDGDKPLSKNFRVSEFACPDGADVILVDDTLVHLLQLIRDKFKRSVIVSSGYRTSSYNSRIGGDIASRHMTGQAADIDVGSGETLADPLLVAMTAQAFGSRSVGCYQYKKGQSWIHVGSSPTDKYWRQAAPGKQVYIATFLPTLRKDPDSSEFCLRLQTQLQAFGNYSGALDGKFGTKTMAAVKAFQKHHGLAVDGVCGPLTWRAILL